MSARVTVPSPDRPDPNFGRSPMPHDPIASPTVRLADHLEPCFQFPDQIANADRAAVPTSWSSSWMT
jgi:hypothetical protein